MRSEFTAVNIRIYSQLPEAIRVRQRSLRRSYGKLWETLLKDAQNAGQLRADIRIKLLRQFLLGALNWTVEWFDAEKHSVKILADNCTKIILDGIVIGPSSADWKKLKVIGKQRNEIGLSQTKSDRTREDIMKAAARLIRDRGYVASTLRDIAAENGMKAGSLYYHFRSKDEIIAAILEQGLQEAQCAVENAVFAVKSGEEHRAKISAAVHAHLSVLLGSSEFNSVNVRVYSQLPLSIREQHQPLLRQFLLGALNKAVEWFDPDRHSVDAAAARCTKLIFDGICVKSK